MSGTVVSVVATVVIMMSSRLLWSHEVTAQRILASTAVAVAVVVAVWMMLGAVTDGNVDLMPAGFLGLTMGAALQIHAKTHKSQGHSIAPEVQVERRRHQLSW